MMLIGLPYGSSDCLLYDHISHKNYWIVQLHFQMLLQELGTDCFGLVTIGPKHHYMCNRKSMQGMLGLRVKTQKNVLSPLGLFTPVL